MATYLYFLWYEVKNTLVGQTVFTITFQTPDREELCLMCMHTNNIEEQGALPLGHSKNFGNQNGLAENSHGPTSKENATSGTTL